MNMNLRQALLGNAALGSSQRKPDPCSIDTAMRKAILAAAACDSAHVYRDLVKVLSRPAKPDVSGVMKHYGEGLRAAQLKVGPLVERLEVAIIGPVSFSRWCAVSGFGEDLAMFEVFLRWADVTRPGLRFTPAIRHDLKN